MSVTGPSTPEPPGGELIFQGERLRRNWWPPGVALVLLIAWDVCCICAPKTRPSEPHAYLFQSWVVVLLAVTVGALCLARNSLPRARSTRLRVSPAGLSIGEDPEIAAVDIAEVTLIARRPRHPEARLVLRDGSVRWLRLAEENAAEMLRILGLAPGGRRGSFDLIAEGWWLSVCVPLFGSCWGVNFFSEHWPRGADYLLVLLGIPFWVLLLWLMSVLLRGQIVIGADGILLRWFLFSRQFFHFREVETISSDEAFADRVLIHLYKNSPVAITPRVTAVFISESGAEARAVEAHLLGALARWREAAARVDAPDELRFPPDTGPAAWFHALHLLALDEAPYRGRPALSAGRLAAVVQNPAADPAIRVGAAVVLLRRGGVWGRGSVQVATDGCAVTGLRQIFLQLENAHSDQDFVDTLTSMRVD